MMRVCKDCNQKVYSHQVYCPRCSADLYARNRRLPKNFVETIFEFRLSVKLDGTAKARLGLLPRARLEDPAERFPGALSSLPSRPCGHPPAVCVVTFSCAPTPP